MASAGAATRRTQGGPQHKYLPLSVFFLQMGGDGGKDDENDDAKVMGVMDRQKGDVKRGIKKLGPMHFDADTTASVIAGQGPRPKAKKRKPVPVKEAVGGTSRFTGTASKPQKCKFCDDSATKSLIWADGRAYMPVCDDHEDKGRDRIEGKKLGDEVVYVRKIDTVDEDTMSGNVATTAVPIGPVLRRVAPVGKKNRKQWMDRLAKMAST